MSLGGEVSALSEDDLKELRRSAADLSDICPCRRAQIERDFKDVYKRAEEIRLRLRNPL